MTALPYNILRGEFHWHHHDDEDESLNVADGRLFVYLEDRTVELKTKHGFTVPRKVEHRTRASEGAVVLLVEGSGVVPTGD